nr:protein FAR1-related sequence 5-like [Tanacetum cinerariifolium]
MIDTGEGSIPRDVIETGECSIPTDVLDVGEGSNTRAHEEIDLLEDEKPKLGDIFDTFDDGYNMYKVYSEKGRYNFQDNKWLSDMYAIRDRWIPGYFKEYPMCGLMKTTSRSESSNAFFQFFSHKEKCNMKSTKVYMHVHRLVLILKPTLALTDQDATLRNAVVIMFPDSKHRLCMWHITQKLPRKVLGDLDTDSEFRKEFHKLIWNVYIRPEVFEKHWNSLIT